MRKGEKEYYRKRIPKILEALKKKGYDPYFFESTDEARSLILERIDPSETVAIGGSITIREDLSIKEELRKRGNQVIDHWEASGDWARVIELKRKNREADVFLSGLNAISSDGILVNLDGGGNRVASLCSGPKRVIVVAGANKIVESVWRQQFIGKGISRPLAVVKTGAIASHEIDSITGATISSRSVCTIINGAVSDLKDPLSRESIQAPSQNRMEHQE